MFGKFFASTFTGSMVGSGLNVFAVWGYVIANTRQDGTVEINPPIVAAVLGCAVGEVTSALDVLTSPDANSRSKKEEGRRLIQQAAFLYSVPTYADYRAIRDDDGRKEYMRQYMQGYRDKKKAVNVNVNAGKPQLAQAEADTDTEEKKQKALVHHTAAPSRFQDFWLAYPNKKSKQEAEKSWRKLKLDSRCDELIDHVRKMAATDADWLRGYIPMGSTYLNQARWDDVPRRPPTNGTAAPSKTLGAMQTLQGIRHGLAGDRTSERANETAFLGFGSDPGE